MKYSPANPFGNEPNNFGTTGDKEYPTAIYTVDGEPKAFSGISFVLLMKYAIAAKNFADSKVKVIFTNSYWSI